MTTRFWAVARAVAWRNLHNFFTNPALVVPALLFPLFFFTAFAGGLSGIDDAPQFDFPTGYTAFEFVFVLLQASAFGGVRSEEHTSELQSRQYLVCRLLLEKKKTQISQH